MGDELANLGHLHRHLRDTRADLCFVYSTLPVCCVLFYGHLLKSALERGFILIGQIFSPGCEALSHTVSKISPSWLSVLNLAFEKCIISFIFHCCPKSRNEDF